MDVIVVYLVITAIKMAYHFTKYKRLTAFLDHKGSLDRFKFEDRHFRCTNRQCGKVHLGDQSTCRTCFEDLVEVYEP